MLTASGFTDIDVAPAEAPMTFGADAGDATDFILAMGPVRYNLRDVDPGTTARIRSEVRDALVGLGQVSCGDACPVGLVWR